MRRSPANAPQRARSVAEGGDAHAGVKERYPFEIQFCGAAESHCPRGLDGRFASALGRLRRRQQCLHIGERAATRGRIATGGGDEHGGCEAGVIRSGSASRTGSLGGNLDQFAAARPTEARAPKAITPNR
jgi:hypothetical protein